MKKYKIYQLDLQNPAVLNERKAYLGWDYIIKHCTGFNFQQYKKVYDGELPVVAGKDAIDYLEEIFTTFNINHPKDYQGRSLSTSDVVVLDDTIYYCDSCGWKEVSKL